MNEIAEGFGDRWDVVRQRVFSTALQFLKKRLADYDTLIPCSDGFIVIFGEDHGEPAELAGHRLAEALNKFFLGEDMLGDCEVSCKHLSLALDDIESFVQALGASPSAPAVQGAVPQDSDQIWEYRIRYRPVCDVKKNFIVTYFTEAIDAKGQPFLPEETAGQTAAMRRAYTELDLAVIDAGVAALRKVVGAGGRIIIGLTIHADTLADHTHRHVVLSALGRIDPELRRYATIRLTHVPPGFPRFHLDEHIRLLHQKQIKLGLDLSIDDPNTDILRHPCLTMFGYHLNQQSSALFRDQLNPTVMQMRVRARRIHEAGKRLAVIADDAPNIAQIAHELEADYISAVNLWPLSPAPEGLHPA
ncbi:MAG: hypothetical protein WAW96_20195 [Alphaproteobacteria bacterium]